MDLLDLHKHRQRWLSPASSALYKSIIPTATHLQHGTEQPDWIRLPLRVNEGLSHVLCLAKKAVAFFKMSRSIRSRRLSSRNWRSSACSGV
jgi:hypothetical protein